MTKKRCHIAARRGFTLIELVAALAITAILMTGMGSAMIIAGQAIPDGRSPVEIAAESRNILDRITEDLLYATSVTEKTTTAITFTVADRNHGPIGPETIRYAWSGTPGDPLTLSYNGAVAVDLIEDVRSFAMTYMTEANAAAPVPIIEQDEEVFVSQDGTNSGFGDTFALGSGTRCAEYFEPSLPADTVSWRITRTMFVISPAGGTTGVIAVEVTAVDQATGEPGSTVETVLLPESDLLAANWHEVQFASAGGLDPASGCFISFAKNSGGGSAGVLSIGVGSVNSPATSYFSDAGSGVWLEDNTTDIWLWVWGKVSRPDPNPPPPLDAWLSAVRIELQVGADSSTRTQTEVQVLNAPDVSGL